MMRCIELYGRKVMPLVREHGRLGQASLVQPCRLAAN